jgi:hypothetical protein
MPTSDLLPLTFVLGPLTFGLSAVSVFAADVEQRFALPHFDMFDFRNKDGVIAGGLGRMQAAFEIGQCAFEHGRPMRGAIEAGTHVFWMLMSFSRLGVVLRDCLLAVAEHVHAETLAGMQVSMGSGAMVDTDEDQRGIQRDGGEGIRGHAMDFAILVDGDDRDPGRERAHSFSEIGSGQTHEVNDDLNIESFVVEDSTANLSQFSKCPSHETRYHATRAGKIVAVGGLGDSIQETIVAVVRYDRGLSFGGSTSNEMHRSFAHAASSQNGTRCRFAQDDIGLN